MDSTINHKEKYMQLYATSRRRMSFLFGVILISQCLLSGAATAVSKLDKTSDKHGYNFSAMATPSQNIVIGKVKSLSSKWVGKVIVTTADVEPIEILKGKAQSKSLKVSYVGGTVGNIRQTLSHPIELVDGETAILFLTDADKSSAFAGSKVFSHYQGKIHLLSKNENVDRLKSNKRILGLVKQLQTVAKKGGLR